MLQEQKKFIKATLTTRVNTGMIYDTAPYIKCVVRGKQFLKATLTMRIDTDVIVLILA